MKKVELTESEIRSIVSTELRRVLKEGSSGSELSLVVGDAMLDGLREMIPALSRSSWVRNAAGQDPRTVVAALLDDHDFRSDLAALVARMIGGGR